MAISYEAKNFDHLLGSAGFSEALLKNHFTLYQGYVANTNKLLDQLFDLFHEGKEGMLEYAEMKRRFGWEFNGMRLHEYYFGNMAKDVKPPDRASDLMQKINEDFGSLAEWEKEFRAVGLMRGIGWVIFSYDNAHNRLFNVWINEHNTGHLMGSSLLLVMDVFEHAYMTDYGIKRADYIDAFFKAIDWNAVQGRYGASYST